MSTTVVDNVGGMPGNFELSLQPKAPEDSSTICAQIGDLLHQAAMIIDRPADRVIETMVRVFGTEIHPGEWENCENVQLEQVKRACEAFFYGIIGLLAIPVSLILATPIRFVADKMVGEPYTHHRGVAPKAVQRSYTAITLNACMFDKGMCQIYGGVSLARNRIDRLAEEIQRLDPDFVLLQEMSEEAGRALCSRLGDRYAHLFPRIGGVVHPAMIGSCLSLLSKCDYVGHEPFFLPFPGGADSMNRGVFAFEAPEFWILNTHLAATTVEARQEQLDYLYKIKNDLRRQTGKPVFIGGDFNVKRKDGRTDEYSNCKITDHFYDPLAEESPVLTEETATCTNLLTSYVRGVPVPADEDNYECDDAFLLNKESKDKFALKVDLIDTYDITLRGAALSDHKILSLKIDSVTPV